VYAIVPLHFFKNRTQTGAVIEIFFIFFSFLLAVRSIYLLHCLYCNSSTTLQAIYLPFLYQAKGHSAVQSGIDVIPFSIATIFGTAVSGGIIRWNGHYKPFLIFGPWFAAISGGLLYTVDTNTPNAKLIGYMIILGEQALKALTA